MTAWPHNTSNSIIKFADGTTYREEVRALEEWCQENNFSFNVNKTKELIVEFRKSRGSTPLSTLTDRNEEGGKLTRRTHH
jgi:hypothetical protein